MEPAGTARVPSDASGWRDVRWAALGVVASTVMQAPFTNFLELGSALSPGDGRVQAWVLAWTGHALSTGQPLFDANMFFPAPAALAHTDHMVALGVVALPFWILTHNAVLVFNLLKILGPALGVWASARLAYAWTGDEVAAAVGGLVFGCSSFMLLHNAHLNLTWSAGLPLAILAFERWWAQPTWHRLTLWWVPAVFTVLVSWYLALMLALALGLWTLALFTTSRGSTAERQARALQLAPGVLLAAAVILPFASPYIGRGSEAGEAAAFAADWRSYVVPPEHTIVGRWIVARGLADPQGIWGERTLFLGWTLAILAVAGVVSALRRPPDPHTPRRVAFLIVLGLLALALSFGPSTSGLAPFDLLARLPAAEGFRATARFSLLVTLAAALLAAYALARLRRALGRRQEAPALIVLAALMLAEVFVLEFPGGAPPAEPMPEIYALASRDGARAAVALPMYADHPHWFLEGDYLLYSTSGDFLPLANGIGRWVPLEYRAMGEAMRDFPSPTSADALRLFGVTHVLFHGHRFEGAAADLLARVRQGSDYTIVAARGEDAVLRVKAR